MKVPLWMLQTQATQFTVCERTVLPASALLQLLELLSVHASSIASAQCEAETVHEAGDVSIRRCPVEHA